MPMLSLGAKDRMARGEKYNLIVDGVGFVDSVGRECLRKVVVK